METHSVERGQDDSPCETLVQLGEKVGGKGSSTPMNGRKQHAATSGGGVVFIHGGWTFDGKTRDPVGRMYAMLVKSSSRWLWLGDSGVRRAGHVCCSDGTRVVLHGGEGAGGMIHGSLYQLVVNSS